MPLQFHQFRCLKDNLGLLVHHEKTGATAVVDAPDAKQVEAALADTGWRLTDIWITHEHQDHVEGIPALKARYKAVVTGSAIAGKVVAVDRVVGEGSSFSFAGEPVKVHATPGHAAGHVIYHLPSAKAALVGDVLFVMGCGRILPGGTAAEMWASLSKVAALPDETMLYGGHDYTLANAAFAKHVDGANPKVLARFAEAEKAKAAGLFWASTKLADEKATNPFLRAGEPALAQAAGLTGAPADKVFAKLREMKNSF